MIQPAFDNFWSVWLNLTHRSRAKKAAELAFKAAVKHTTPERIEARLRLIYRTEWHRREIGFIPYASSWLRAEDWQEEEVEMKDQKIPPALMFETHPFETHLCEMCDKPHWWDCEEPHCDHSYEVACPDYRKMLLTWPVRQ
jgi:hypothetical protein